MKQNKKIVFLLSSFLAFLLLPVLAKADVPSIEITPLVIEEDAKIRDILEYTIKIKNNSKPYKASIYPIVSDIKTVDGKQQMMDFATTLNKTENLSRWMTFARGVIDLMPGEEKSLALKINVDPNAKPGKYRAAIMFSEAPDRYAAEANAKITSQPQVFVNINITEHIVERAEISVFEPQKDIFLSMPAKLELEIKNIGNIPLIPKGSIYVYNRRGVEVSKIEVNVKDEIIQSEEKKDFSQNWSMPSAFGRYKAKLEIEYGNSEKRDLQDTIYFWVLPKKILFFFAGILFILMGFLIALNVKRKQTLNLTLNSHESPVKAVEENTGVLNLKRK